MVKLEINENSSFILITLTLIYCCFYFTDLQKILKSLNYIYYGQEIVNEEKVS